VKQIKEVIHELWNDWEDDVEQQSKWIETYRMDPIKIGRMCTKYPVLKNAWDQFRTTYELCKSQDDIDNEKTNTQ